MFNNRLEDIENSENPPFTYAYADFTTLTRPKAFHTMTVMTAEGEFYRGYEALLTEAKRIQDHGFTAAGTGQGPEGSLTSRMFTAYNNRNNRESVVIAQDYVRHFLDGTPAPGY